MSAFLCQPYMIGQLAKYYSERVKGDATPRETAQDCAALLAMANLASVGHRYPTDGSVAATWFDDYTNDAQYIAECKTLSTDPTDRRIADSATGSVTVLSMAGCFDYQACEYPGYFESMTAGIVREIRGEAIRRLPGMGEAPTDLTPLADDNVLPFADANTLANVSPNANMTAEWIAAGSDETARADRWTLAAAARAAAQTATVAAVTDAAQRAALRASAAIVADAEQRAIDDRAADAADAARSRGRNPQADAGKTPAADRNNPAWAAAIAASAADAEVLADEEAAELAAIVADEECGPADAPPTADDMLGGLI